MAVFTELTGDEVRAFVAHLQAGELQSVQPVHAGIENTKPSRRVKQRQRRHRRTEAPRTALKGEFFPTRSNSMGARG